MPKTTKNFGLIQPEEYENYDIEVQNQNMCKIEEALSKRKEYDPEALTAEEALKSSIQYTDEKMEDLIGSAPEALDTIYELAAAIKDNEEIMEIIRKAVNESAKKEDLTAHENDKTVHVTEQERKSWNDSNSRKHDHDNKSILDSITQSLITAWNDAVEHITDGTRHVTSKDKELWNTVSDKAGTGEIITEIKMNGESKGTSGVIDLGTVLTGGNQTAVSADDGGSNVYTFSDGSTINIRNGSKGSKGDTGAQGTAGKNGTNGTSATWFTGTAVTGTSTTAATFAVAGSKAGDMYLNTSTCDVYKALAANSWIYVCNIKGDTGAQGEKGATGEKGANGTNGVTPTLKAAAGANIGVAGAPSVTANTSGNTTTFTFNNLKGEKGDKGDAGKNATTTAVATTAVNGLMSKDDKIKLDGIETKIKTAVFFVKK